MTSDDERRPVRRGRSDVKRASILEAATALFLADGFDRTSTDAIASRAGVSKRTVYDHFGDKERLHRAVMTEATADLLVALQAAVDEELPPGCDPASSLLAFARRVATETFGSSEYALFRKLLASAGSAGATDTDRDPADLLADRIARFHRDGALSAPDSSRAAEHFVALTFLIALDSFEQRSADELDRVLVDGVAAFVRAYRPTATT